MSLLTTLTGLFMGLLARDSGPSPETPPAPPTPLQPDPRALYDALVGMNGGEPSEMTPLRLYSTRPATAEDARRIFAPAKPLPGVVPEFAMDTLNNPLELAGYGYGGLTEGMSWLGFPYLAELAQRTEYRRISETIAKDMTRRWFRLQATGDDDKTDKIKALEELMKFHKLQEKFTLLALLDGFFGRSHLYIDTGETDDLDLLKLPLPIDPRVIVRGGLKGLRVVEPMWCYPQDYNSNDPLKSDFYLPQTWWVMGKKIHRTRILPFVNREMPDMLKPAYSYAGLSLSQMAKPYVDNWLRTRQSVSDLIHSFSTPVMMTNMGSVLNAGASSSLKMRAALFNYLRDNNNLMILDKTTEDFKNVSAPLGGLDHLQAQSQEHMASAVGIPLVVLLGISPSGLNATSEGELQVWAQFIHAAQGSFFDAHLTTLLKIFQLHLFGEIDPSITHAWEPLRELSEEEESTAEKTQADIDAVYINAGVLSPDEIRQRLSGEADSPYQGLDLDSPAPPPPSQEPDPLGGEGVGVPGGHSGGPAGPGGGGGPPGAPPHGMGTSAPAGGSAGPVSSGAGKIGAAGGSAKPPDPNKGAKDDEEILPGTPGTGHTMVRTQDPNAHIHVHMGPRDRAQIKMGQDGAIITMDAFDPSEHPRGQPQNAGEFGPGGGGGGETDAPKGHGVTGLPEGKLPRELKNLTDRGGYQMAATKMKKSGFESGDRYEVIVTAKAPAGIKTINEGRRTAQYDPKLAEVETLNPDVPEITRDIAKVKDGLSWELPVEANPEHMYRGMDADEFASFQKTGQIKSKSDYNLQGQEALTYWSSEPSQAESYANSFAPPEHKPTFDKPCYVMVAKRVDPGDEVKVKGTGESEIGVNRAIGKDEVLEVWRGKVAVFDAGNYTLSDRGGEFETGGATAPSASVVWEKVSAQQAHDKEPWDETKHPRGQPENKGEFGPGGGGASPKTEAPEAKPAAAPAPRPAAATAVSTPTPRPAVSTPVSTPTPIRSVSTVAATSPQHHTVEFYSPSVAEHLDLAQASAGLHSERQRLLETASHEIDTKLNLRSTSHPAIGAWSDGAENSVMTEMDGASWDEIELATAMKAHLANQKDALVFMEGEGDQHLYSFHATGSVEKIHQDLLADGVAFHTIVPTQEGATIYAVDMGGDGDETAQAVAKAAQRYGTTPTDQPGRAKFLVGENAGTTGQEQRHEAQLAYGRIIKGSGVQNAASVWQSIRPTYGQAFEITEFPKEETTTPLPGSQGHPALISTRRITTVGANESDEYRRIDMDAMKQDDRVYKDNMNLLKNDLAYSNLRPEEVDGKTPAEIERAAINLAKSNLRFLYEHAPAAVREQGPEWYEGAHDFAARKAKEYGIPLASAAAVYAALSPQNLWEANVKQGDAVLDIYFHHQDTAWSPEMTATAARIWKPKDARFLARIQGKTLAELQLPAEKAMWIRTYDEAHNSPGFNRLTPSGDAIGPYYNLDGTPAKASWKTTGAIANAIASLESGGNRDVISISMGDLHKVRSFYNNILDPHSANDDVTMDTHAVGAVLLRPETGNSTTVAQSLKTAPEKSKREPGFVGASGSGAIGVQGTYALWADAYRELAHELHIEPRVLQSVTWVAKRKMFDSRTTDETKAAVQRTWREYHDGTRTLEDTQNEVLKLSGGMDKPDDGTPQPAKPRPPPKPRTKKA